MRGATVVVILILVGHSAGAHTDDHMLAQSQKSAIQVIETNGALNAAPMAQRLAIVVRHIYENRLAATPDQTLLASLSTAMGNLNWQLLSIKSESMSAAIRVLTPAQKQLVGIELATHQTGTDLPDLMEVMRHVFQMPRQ